ncbi:unnamed protein product [Effrenium voratum]|uniref:Uncharacterized protein n=1 Tax=Effrenium voratum TaxID=2562239 RepID=A0AA36NE99_9DINO|nr:unnamed protein product [Effrenium voratum]
MEPVFRKFELEKVKLDKLLEALHEKAAVAENHAKLLKEAFHKVQVAHEEGNCQRATAAAEANFEDLPMCKHDLDQASEDMSVHFQHAQPSCKRGAVSLEALRELSTPWPLLLARPELAWSIKAFERRSKTPALESSIREEISFSKC